MSRHRLVKKMNIADELDDDALSDGGEDDLTSDQQAQMDDGLARVRAVLGPPEECGLEDSVIKDALWNEYFHVENAIQGLLEERERDQRAMERKDDRESKELPPLPANFRENSHVYSDEEGFYQSDASSPYFQPYDAVEGYEADMDGRPRVPLIVLAQQGQHPPPLPEPSDPGTYPYRYRLSTISEKSERTEASRHWPSRQQLYAYNDPQPSSPMSSNTSYGQLIEHGDQSQSQFAVNYEEAAPLLVDPNDIPPSPSPSAQLRLSHYEPAPSVATSESRSTPTPPQAPTAPLPPIETIPDIPDYKSKSTARPVPPALPSTASAKKSKLSALASSRASSVTKSSRTQAASKGGGTGPDSASVITYPALRPSTESRKSLSAASTISSSSASTVKPPPKTDNPSSTSSHSTSSHVRRAIQTALELEATDRGETPKTKSQTIPPASKDASKTSSGLSPMQSQASTSSPLSPTDSHMKGRPSKLALLAQAKAQANANAQHTPWMPSVKLPNSNRTALPDSHTEYLMPIANGPTATTAITTSYQSLYSLQSRTVTPPSPPSPIEPPRPRSSNNSDSIVESKKSKLVMKSKKSKEKPAPKHPSEEDFRDFGFTPPVSPMFLPKTVSSRALPSAFASLLVDDRLISSNSEDKVLHKDKGNKKVDLKSVEPTSPSNAMEKPKRRRRSLPQSSPISTGRFTFDVPSPDDIVSNARRGTSLAQQPAKEREKTQKLSQKKKVNSGPSSTITSRATSPVNTPSGGSKKAGRGTPKASGTSTPIRFANGMDQRQIDMSALNISSIGDEERIIEEPPKMALAREKVIEEAKKVLEARGEMDKRGVSLVVVGHVDAGKSTLMGRLLYELGRFDEKKRIANERGSSKIGKSSFSWAWELDGTLEERQRGITMDIAQQSLTTPRRQITILDAPGHRDFIPNMISGASQADCALLVVDASTGEFEAGFDRGGQTREHLVLVRSLGVTQVVVAVNKLDQVQWQKDRYDKICNLLRPFLLQSGFQPSKTKFLPVGAINGVNLLFRGEKAKDLVRWYDGPTLVDLLDQLEPPTRDVTSSLRLPISNVFKGQNSSIAVSGRVCGGVVQVGERVRVLPGDETAIIKMIDIEEENRSWAAAGSNVTVYLTSIDPVHVNIGAVLCPLTDPIPLAAVFTAQIIIFDIQVPITAGTSVELFHHSRDIPATISKLIASLDRASGTVVKQNPRVLTKGASAEVQISIRAASISGPSSTARPIPLEPFSSNKDMGRILIRRGGETIAAGIVLTLAT